jgi:uncharacterized protein (UPF0248 family)
MPIGLLGCIHPGTLQRIIHGLPGATIVGSNGYHGLKGHSIPVHNIIQVII